MKKDIEQLVKDLKEENSRRTEMLNKRTILEERRKTLIYKYNNTIEIIKRLEEILTCNKKQST